MNLKEQLDTLLDATTFDSTGTKVGAVRQVYVDDASGKLTFATVSTGIFSADAIVPLHGARLLDDELHVDHTRAVIRDSPRPENTEDALTPEQEGELLEHYGLEAPGRDRGAAEQGTRAESTPRPGAAGPTSASDKTAGSANAPDASRAEKKGVGKAAGDGGRADRTRPDRGTSAAEADTPGTDASETSASKSDSARAPSAKTESGRSGHSPAAEKPTEKKSTEQSASPARTDAKSNGPAAGQKTAAPGKTTAAPAAAPGKVAGGEKTGEKATGGEKSGGKMTDGGKRTTTTSHSPDSPPAGPDHTESERPGPAGSGTAATSENSGKSTPRQRD